MMSEGRRCLAAVLATRRVLFMPARTFFPNPIPIPIPNLLDTCCGLEYLQDAIASHDMLGAFGHELHAHRGDTKGGHTLERYHRIKAHDES